MLFFDGVYVIGKEVLAFRRVRPPARESLEDLVQTIGQWVGAYLERQGLLMRDIENTCLVLESTEASAMDDLLDHSISYRIVVGPHAGRKAIALQMISVLEDRKEDEKLAKASGFSILRSVSGTSLLPFLTPCRCRNTSAPTTKAGAAMPIHRSPRGIDRTHSPDELGECALYTERHRTVTVPPTSSSSR